MPLGRRDRAGRVRRRALALALGCVALVSTGGCDSDAQPVSYSLGGYGMTGGRVWILVTVPRAYAPDGLREVFDRVRAENLEPEHAVFVAIKCETGNDEVGADRLAFGRYAVGAGGAEQARLPAGEAAFSVFKGRTCAPRTVEQEARANRPAERADAYALEQSGGIRTGCDSGASRSEAAREPGCVYLAARRGCLDALNAAARSSPKALRERFPVAALRRAYNFAVMSCAE